MEIKTSSFMTDQANIKFIRPQKLAENIIFVDGLSGSGKSLIAPLLSTFKRAELWKFNYLIEYLCSVDAISTPHQDSTKVLIQTLVDLDLYNLMIAREVNLRPSDLSSASSNLLLKPYQKRLKANEGDGIVKDMQRKKPFFIMMLHFQFIHSHVLFDALKERLKLYVISLRHPLWLVESWYRGAWHRGVKRHYGGSWSERFGRDPREFTLCCNVDDEVVPWFAADWCEEYQRLRPLDQAIRVVYRLNEKIQHRYDEMSEEDRQKVLLVPFELFVSDPAPFVNQIAEVLKTKKTALTTKIMKKIQIPRAMIRSSDLKTQRLKIKKWINDEKVSPESQKMVDQMCSYYECRYLEKLAAEQEVLQ